MSDLPPWLVVLGPVAVVVLIALLFLFLKIKERFEAKMLDKDQEQAKEDQPIAEQDAIEAAKRAATELEAVQAYYAKWDQ